jgi:hypothetical protein
MIEMSQSKIKLLKEKYEKLNEAKKKTIGLIEHNGPSINKEENPNDYYLVLGEICNLDNTIEDLEELLNNE